CHRRGGNRIRRSEIDLGCGRAHAAPEVARGARDRHGVGGQHVLAETGADAAGIGQQLGAGIGENFQGSFALGRLLSRRLVRAHGGEWWWYRRPGSPGPIDTSTASKSSARKSYSAPT